VLVILALGGPFEKAIDRRWPGAKAGTTPTAKMAAAPTAPSGEKTEPS